MKRCLLFLVVALLPIFSGWAQPNPPTLYPNPEAALQLYRSNLTRLRQEHLNHRSLPDLSFFLFGMGDRAKYIYRAGRLIDALTGHIEEQWTVKSELIVPSEYLVHLTLDDNSTVQIREDETGVWLIQAAATNSNKLPKVRRIRNTKRTVNLPRFASNTFGPVLRVLHHDLLINLIAGSDGVSRPVSNVMVYTKPSYGNAALMGMVLKKTDNLRLIRDWILSIRDPFDWNKPGVAEVDNVGQVLFLVSLVSDRNHPVVQMALDSVNRFRKDKYILGKTDNEDHPVFQTKWLKYGLKSLGLPDPYIIPKQYDSYSALFWWDFTKEHVAGPKFDEEVSATKPYLVWAEDHFYHEKRGMLGTVDYPLSWEQKASDAHYPALTVLDKELVKQKLAFPHARHAAEMFLLLSDQ
ncbi:hypothetical protein M0L20_02085 [Spirosoma sp. RP8]|uniref:Uncharacterized protein n=1 Tax=Spirosoma liriopis TaxID=2937440 RepID=A0ABT0HEN8_9BACT|nr:hypothetical protein [Spirosoma liriopis]MCK8490621.1 hypothetical protein [Spirosoma liriopis]